MGDYYRHARNIDLIVRAIERRLAIVERPGWQQAMAAGCAVVPSR